MVLAIKAKIQNKSSESCFNHDPEFIDTSGKKLAKLWDIHDYLWFSIINQETDAFFKKNYKLIPGFSKSPKITPKLV